MKIRLSSILDITPFHLVFLSAAIYVLFTSIPPTIYTFFVNEPDWMYFNLDSGITEVVFITVFCLGLLSSQSLGLPRRKVPVLNVNNIFHYIVIGIIFFEVAAVLISYYVISQEVPDLLLDFLTSNGAAVKEALYNSGGIETYQGIIPVATATILWVFHIYGQPQNRERKTLFFSLIFYFFIILFVLYLLITLARSTIIILAFGVLVQRIIQERNSGLRGIGSRKWLLALPVVAIGFFILLGSVRGITGIDSQISELLGYGPASFNRQALIFAGDMDISGVWLTHENFGFLASIPFLSHTQILQGIFGATNEPEVEFFQRVTALAGLNPQYVWPGVFGSIFGEFGFFGLFYVFVYGFLTYETYKRAKLGLTFGVVMYCFVAWSILFWFGFNNLLSGEITYVIIFLILARLIERLTFKRRDKRPFNTRTI